MELDDYARLKAFLSSRKEWFWKWRSPTEAIEELNLINRIIQSDYPLQSSAFVTRREAKQLREVWVLAKCANSMSIPEIKLSIEDPPDGYIRRRGDAVPAEVLEIMEPGRKRNLEFAPDAPQISMDPGENWVRRANAIPGALAEGIQKKKSKIYPQSTELFVYLNIGEYGIRQKEIEGYIRLLLVEPVKPFDAIHVRWKEKTFSNCGAVYEDSSFAIDSEMDDESLWDR